MDIVAVSGADRIAEIASPIVPAKPEDKCGEIERRFREDLDLLVLAIVDDMGKPRGLINRHELTIRLSDQYGWALFERKPITELMDPTPLVVDAETTIDGLGQVIVDERPSALMSGFIVARDGKYLGVVTALAVLKKSLTVS